MQQRHLLKSEPWVSVCPLFPPHLRRQSAHPLSLDPESEMHHPLPVFPSPLLVQIATVPISVLRFYLSFPDPRVGGLRDKSVPVTLLTNRKSLISLWGKAPILSQILRPSSCQQPMLPAPLSPATLASVFSAKRLPSKALREQELSVPRTGALCPCGSLLKGRLAVSVEAWGPRHQGTPPIVQGLSLPTLPV